MKNKKITLSIIISAIMILLFGTTFAYFSLSKINNTSAINFNGHIERKGDVTLSNWNVSNFRLDFDTIDMSKGNEGYYYASSTEEKPYVLSESEGTYKFAKLEVNSGADDIDYYCTVDVNVKADGTMRTALESGDFLVTINGGSLNTRLDLYKIKNTGKETYKVMFNLHGNETKYIETYLRLKNKSTDQNYLKNTNMNIGIEASNLNCEIVDKKYMDITSEDKDLRTILGDKVSKVKTVQFVRYLDEEINEETITPTSNIPYIYDISETGDKSVLAWLKVNTTDNTMYDLYIGSKNRIYTKNLNGAFSGFTNMESITFDNFDTGEVTDMSSMFNGASKLKAIDVSTFDTSNVTGTSGMFSDCSSLTSLIGANRLNMSKVTGINTMFSEVGLSELDLSGWDLSSLTSGFRSFISGNNLTNIVMTDIKIITTNSFDGFTNSNNIELIDLSNWDASKVTDRLAFNRMIPNDVSKEVSLIMPNWDVVNLTDLSNSFSELPFTTMDLSGWNTEKVNNLASTFSSNNKLVNLNLDGWKSQNVSDMSNMLKGDSLLQNLNLEEWTAPNVIDLSGMFLGCSSLTQLDLDDWDVHNVTNVSGFVSGCTSLTKLSMNNWNLENLTSISGMFGNNLEVLEMANWSIPKVTSLSYVFSGKSTLKNIDMKNWNAPALTSLSYLFAGCSNLQSIEMNGLEAPNLAYMETMFVSCANLKQIDMSDWNVKKVQNISSLFSNCTNLETVKMDNWNAISLTYISGLFANDDKLINVEMNGWIIANKISFSSAFSGCTKLETINMNNWNTTTLTDMSYMFQGVSFTQDDVKLNAKNWDISNVTNMESTFVGNGFTEMDLSNWKTPNLQNLTTTFNASRKLVSLNVRNWDVSNVTSMMNLFIDASKLSNLDINGWQAKKIEDVQFMFSGTSSLNANIDFSNWDVSNLTNMNYMFQSSGIKNVNLSNWNLKNLREIDGIFHNNQNLEYVNLSNWNIPQVNNLGQLFRNTSVKNIDMKNLKSGTSKLSLTAMVYNCANLNTIDLSGWDVSTVTDFDKMFGNFHGSIDSGNNNIKLIAHNWKFGNNVNLSSMFHASYLKEIDLSGWDTKNVIDTNNMFLYNKNLTTLVLDGWNTSNVTNMESMFNDSSKLTRLDLSSFDTSKVTSMNFIFASCSNLEYLNINKANFNNVSNYGSMFADINPNVNIVVNSNSINWIKARLNELNLPNVRVNVG